MSRRDVILIVVSVAIILVAVVLLVRHLTQPAGPNDAEYQEVLRSGNRIHVACTNPDCKHEQDDYRAHSYDRAWPKTCPKCGKDTLYRAKKCTGCGKYTPWKLDDKGRVYCVHCNRWLNPTPGSDEPGVGTPAGP